MTLAGLAHVLRSQAIERIGQSQHEPSSLQEESALSPNRRTRVAPSCVKDDIDYLPSQLKTPSGRPSPLCQPSQLHSYTSVQRCSQHDKHRRRRRSRWGTSPTASSLRPPPPQLASPRTQQPPLSRRRALRLWAMRRRDSMAG